MTLEFRPGDVVSSATLRSADLIPAFYGALVQALVVHGNARFDSLLNKCRAWMKNEREGFEDPKWRELTAEHDEIGSELTCDLIDALNEFAPSRCYFGANEGDGACFGFWQVDEESE